MSQKIKHLVADTSAFIKNKALQVKQKLIPRKH